MTPQVLNRMIAYFEKDVRRINHAIKVHSFAKNIAFLENLSEKETIIVELSAILHDIGIKEAERKYNSSAGKYQEMESPAVARQIMIENGVGEDVIERVAFVVGNHHSYNKIDNIDFQILIEADFIVNAFEDEISKSAIENFMRMYFKTESGKKIMDSMY